MAQECYPDEENDLEKPLPLWLLILMPFYIGGLLGIALFPIAGNWGWLEAWILVLTFSINLSIGFVIINGKNPRVLCNRMKVKKEGLTSLTRKSAGSDRWVMPVMSIGFIGALILPAFAHRLDWPALPFGVEMSGLVLSNLGAFLMQAAMLQNAYASKILDINQGQTLIDTGLYSHVRHLLYAGAILMILALPVALGTPLALFPAALAVLTLIARIQFEEDMLVKGMDGYEGYKKGVRYKIIPRVY